MSETSADIVEGANRAGANFLKLDVEMGLTFCGLALQTRDSEKRARTQRAARTAYDTVLKLMERVRLNDDQVQWLERKLHRLKCELLTLGEIF